MRKIHPGAMYPDMPDSLTDTAVRTTTRTIVKGKLTLLTAIEQIVELSERSGLNEKFFTDAKRFINYVSRKMKLTPIQTVLLSVAMDNCEDQQINNRNFSNHFGCRPIKILSYLNELDVLVKRGLLICRHFDQAKCYRVPQEVIDAMKENVVYVPKDYSNISCIELFVRLNDMFIRKSNCELTDENMYEEIQDLFAKNKQLAFVRKTLSYALPDDDFVLLLFFCHLFVDNNDDNIGAGDLEDLYDNDTELRMQMNSLTNDSNILIKYNFIEHSNDGGFADKNAFRLTDWAKCELLSELNLNLKGEDPKKDLLLHEKLVEKKLIYEKGDEEQVAQLTELLQQDNFVKVQERLTANGMRKGFTCLFYGAPGTGKTETVFQIARQTGRDIMQVDISAIKSMWVGESEKNIQALFNKYRHYVKHSKIVPILLFNEADAIIGKRHVGASQAVDKMDNAIQNIILQEMERLDGILIATTNLTANMDKAFERRFLYKIEFKKPTLEARSAIWHIMMPSLDEDSVRQLAMTYNFSGGQIENIARKQMVTSILTNSEVSLEALKGYCDSELIARDNASKKVGFLQ
jgi:hypothetical protein